MEKAPRIPTLGIPSQADKVFGEFDTIQRADQQRWEQLPEVARTGDFEALGRIVKQMRLETDQMVSGAVSVLHAAGIVPLSAETVYVPPPQCAVKPLDLTAFTNKPR